MKKGMDKRGLQLAINTIVTLVLALVVLAFMVIFFTGTSTDFMNKIKSYFSYSNVDNLVSSCNILSETNAQYSFCCEKKLVKYYEDGEKNEGEFNCFEIADKFGNIDKLNCDGVSC